MSKIAYIISCSVIAIVLIGFLLQYQYSQGYNDGTADERNKWTSKQNEAIAKQDVLILSLNNRIKELEIDIKNSHLLLDKEKDKNEEIINEFNKENTSDCIINGNYNRLHNSLL